MKRILGIIIFFVVLFLFSPSVLYAEENWTIQNFKSDITVQNDGKVYISEVIQAVFSSQKHGIYRDIPYAYNTEKGGKLYTSIEVLNVFRNNVEEPNEILSDNGYIRIKIGSANKTINGNQEYKIEYLVAGVLQPFETHDELYWNVTGNNWPVEIKQAFATVTLPTGAITQIACFEGIQGSKTPCISQKTSDTSASFQAQSGLLVGQELSIVVGYTKGAVPLLTVSAAPEYEKKTSSTLSFSLWDAVIFFGVLGVGSFLAWLLWYKRGRDVGFGTQAEALGVKNSIGGHETVVVEFEPPHKLRPAEIGVLMDERADTLDVTATIIDLAVRKYLTIEEIPKKWIFGSVDYTLHKGNKGTGGLLGYETLLFEKLFEGKNSVTISSLKTTFYEDLQKVKEQLYKDVVTKKFFHESPQSQRTAYTIIAVVIMVIGGFILFNSLFSLFLTSFPFSIGLALLLVGVIFLVFSHFMARKTAYGRETYRRSQGYDLFIGTAEKYRQQFFEKKNLFNEVLPYAIIFGKTEKFAKAFAEMGIQPETNSWYRGSTTFNAVTFGSHVHSFSSSFSMAISATAPKGSGLSGGGGFSGGGFGGGGGGSW